MTKPSRRGAAFFGDIAKHADDVQSAAPAPGVRGKSYLGGLLNENNEGLRDQLERLQARFEGAVPVREIRPEAVVRGIYANRTAASFIESMDPAFKSLKAQIAATGGNLVPIFVRPIAETDTYELVYGERRLRACEQLGLAVDAIVAAVGDEQAALLQHHENNARQDISPIERGRQVCSWLTKAVRGDASELAKQLGMSRQHLHALKLIGELPADLDQVHPDIRRIRSRSARLLALLHRDHHEVLTARIEQLKSLKPIPSPAEATAFLLTDRAAKKARPTKVDVAVTANGLTLPLDHLDEAAKAKFVRAIVAAAEQVGIKLNITGLEGTS